MSALEEYAEFKANVKPLDDPIQEAFEVYADAAIADLNGLMDMMRENAVDRERRIAELEAENRRMADDIFLLAETWASSRRSPRPKWGG